MGGWGKNVEGIYHFSIIFSCLIALLTFINPATRKADRELEGIHSNTQLDIQENDYSL